MNENNILTAMTASGSAVVYRLCVQARCRYLW